MTRQLVDIDAVVRIKRPAAIGIADGSTVEHVDPHTGEITEKERLIWLPLSQVEVDPSDYDVGDTVQITVPLWLAKEKELV